MTDPSFSLVDLKGISEPLTKLIDTVSKGIGAIYEPTRKVRNAKAEAKAMVILAEAELEANSVATRAYERINYREIRRQCNIDSIVKGASELMPDEVSSDTVNEDWIVNFFDLSQDVGDSQMQKIWSRLLAGEVTTPGAFNPRTLQTVKSLTPEEARMFTNLCNFSFGDSSGKNQFPLLGHEFFKYVRANGITTFVETHLKNIGLLNSNKIYHANVYEDEEEESRTLFYFSKAYDLLENSNTEHPNIDVVYVSFPFTEIGNELAGISGAEPDEDYIEHLVEHCGLSLKT